MTVFCVTETKSVLYAAAPENFKNVKDKSVKEWNSMKDRYMEFRRARRDPAIIPFPDRNRILCLDRKLYHRTGSGI